MNVPETNIQIAIPIPEHITSGRRLKRFKNHAFINDITKRVTPTKIDTWYGLTVLPISCNLFNFPLNLYSTPYIDLLNIIIGVCSTASIKINLFHLNIVLVVALHA